MQKNFPLKEPGKADARVIEAIKGDVRKYAKRERRKKLPEGFTEWILACRIGPDRDKATACHVDELGSRIDAIANDGGAHIYIEILAQPGHRPAPKVI